MRPPLRSLLLLAAAIAAAPLGACTRTVVSDPLDARAIAPGAGELDFWHQLPGRPAVSNSEAMLGVLLLADGRDPAGSHDARMTLLKERGWLSQGFDEPPTHAVQRGTLARMTASALGVRGGVMMHITGGAGRYALRELIYANVFPPSTENQTVSGLEFLAIISKAQDYMTAHGRGPGGAVMPMPPPPPPSSTTAPGA